MFTTAFSTFGFDEEAVKLLAYDLQSSEVSGKVAIKAAEWR